MALLTCTECNGNVSSQAATCPHCGKPIHCPKHPFIIFGEKMGNACIICIGENIAKKEEERRKNSPWGKFGISF